MSNVSLYFDNCLWSPNSVGNDIDINCYLYYSHLYPFWFTIPTSFSIFCNIFMLVIYLCQKQREYNIFHTNGGMCRIAEPIM